MKAIQFSEMIHFSFRAVNVSGTSISIHLDVRYAIIYFWRVIKDSKDVGEFSIVDALGIASSVCHRPQHSRSMVAQRHDPCHGAQ